MTRDGEVKVDCVKLRQLLLVECKLTKSSVEKRLNQGAAQITHSVLHRMLGGPKRKPELCATVKIENLQAAMRLARAVLKVSEADLPLERVLWADSEAAEPSNPGLEAFQKIREDSIRTHLRAMADRHLAFKLYGQALCPLGRESGLVVTRNDPLTALDEAGEITAPVRRAGTIETFIRGAPIVVLGEEGVGKTWLVAQWWLTRRPDNLLLFLPGPRFRGAETDTGRILQDGLLALLDSARAQDAETWRQQLETDAFAASAQNQTLIVIDGLNEAPDTNWQIVIEALWQTAVRWGARLVLTSRPAYWVRRRRDLEHWDCPQPAVVMIEGFNLAELSSACSLAGRELNSIPLHLRERLCNPRIFKLAIQLLPSLRSESELSIDRLLYAYWEQRQRDRPELAKLDPDRNVMLRGLAHHAEEFHRRRLEVARDHGHDLAADAVGYDLDSLQERFPGLARYRGPDGETASLLIGEIREGRFFDDDSLTPSESYVFRKESLAFALGLYLIEESKRTLREHQPELTLDHLRERLAALLEPVLDFDQTADQVMAALTVACRDPDVPELIAGALLDQFLELRNRAPRMKAVLGGLAIEKPSVFCGAAERALDLDDPERVDTWLTAALGAMIVAGVGVAACGSWIVSPVEDELSLCGGKYPAAPDAARARRREKFAAMVLAGQNLQPFTDAFLDWAVLATSKEPFGRPDKLRTPLAQTFIAQLIRCNDRDPEVLTAAVATLSRTDRGLSRGVNDCAIAMLLALIASPVALAEAERLRPGICRLVDPPEEFPLAEWRLALDPDGDPSRLLALLGEARAAGEGLAVDPYRPEGEAFRALAARCNPAIYAASVRASLQSLLTSGPDASDLFSAPAKSLMSLVFESTSTIDRHGGLCLDGMLRMLAIVAGSSTRVPRDAEEELGQVMATLMAIAPDTQFRELLLAAPWRPLHRADEGQRREFWGPELPASLVLNLVAEAISNLVTDTTGDKRRSKDLLEAMAVLRVGEAPIDQLSLLTDRILHAEPAVSDVQPAIFDLASRVNGPGLALQIARSGWTASAATEQPLMRRISGLLAEKLAGVLPVVELARMVHPMDLPRAADGVSDDEMPILCQFIEAALVADRSGGPLPPTAGGARRLLKFGCDWITAHVKWHASCLSVLVEGYSPTIDPFVAALLAYGGEPIQGGVDYLLTLLSLTRLSRDKATFLLIKTAIAVCLHEPNRRRQLLDNVVLRITDDRVLAALAKAAREFGPEHVAIVRQYGAELAASSHTIRIAYGVMLSALLLVEFKAAGEPEVSTYLGKVGSYARKILKAHRHARFWADRRLSSKDFAAEHLALCFPSAPFPGAVEDCVLPADADKLDRAFLFRFQDKANGWGFDTLFGLPAPPKWLSAMKAES